MSHSNSSSLERWPAVLAFHFAAVFFVSGLIRDLTFAIRREPDHGNVILW